MTIDVAQFGYDIAAELMAKDHGLFQGLYISYYHRTQSDHVPGVPYQGPSFTAQSVLVNSVIEAPGMNDVRKSEPATAHSRRLLVRRAELPEQIDVGDKWIEPDGTAYEVSALPWGDPAQATLWLVGERSSTP